MQIISIRNLNKNARIFLLEHCISKRNVEIMVIGFKGYINSNTYQHETLIRKSGKWYISATNELILSMVGEIDCFQMTKNTLF